MPPQKLGLGNQKNTSDSGTQLHLFSPDPYILMFLHQLETNTGTKTDFTERIFEMSTPLSFLDKNTEFYYLDQFTGFPKKLLVIFQVRILRTIS